MIVIKASIILRDYPNRICALLHIKLKTLLKEKIKYLNKQWTISSNVKIKYYRHSNSF